MSAVRCTSVPQVEGCDCDLRAAARSSDKTPTDTRISYGSIIASALSLFTLRIFWYRSV